MRFARVLIVFAAIYGCSGPIGEDFKSVDAIVMSDSWKDWVVVGRFGPGGPFEVTHVKQCEISEACSFSHEGTGHTYNGFNDYKLTVLQLEDTNGDVSHVVLRSNDKLYFSD